MGVLYSCALQQMGGAEKINLAIKVNSLFDVLLIDKMKLKNILELF